MKNQAALDWQGIRNRAEQFPDQAIQFVREGLLHTAKAAHRRADGDAPAGPVPGEESKHVSGQQLCAGLRGLAMERYGLLARAVLSHWGIFRTDDFGTIVYALIDRGEFRSSESDTIDDFRGVFGFDEAFQTPWAA